MVASGADRVEARLVERDTDRAGRFRELTVGPPGDGRGPGVGGGEPEQHPQRGRLARAVGPQEAGDRSRLDPEGQPVHGSHRPERLGQALEAAELVRREPHPTDRRATLVTLTEEGHSTLAGWRSRYDQLAHMLFDDLTADDLERFEITLDHMLDRIRDALPVDR